MGKNPFSQVRLIALAAVAFVSVTAGSAVIFATRSGPEDKNQTTGVPILQPGSQRAVANTGLELRGVQANAFSTVIELLLELAEPRDGSDTISIHAEDVTLDPRSDDGQVEVSSITGGADGMLHITLTAGPLPPGTRGVAVAISRYFVLPGDRDGRMVLGPWQTSGQVDLAHVPTSTTVAGTSTLDAGHGLAFVLDDVESDGIMLAVSYHVRGDVTGIFPMGQNPTLVLADGTEIPGEAGPNVTNQTETIQFAISGADLDGMTLRLPPLIREHDNPHELTIARTAGGWTGSAVVAGEQFTASVIESGGFVHVRVEGPEGGTLVLTGAVTGGATLTDDTGTKYDLYHGTDLTPDNNPGVVGPVSIMDFAGEIPTSVQKLALRVGGHQEILRGDWLMPLD